MPWGPTEWDHTRHAMVTDVKGYECRMSPTLEYRTELRGHLDDKTTIRIISLDFDFLERVSDWVKEHYPNGELSGGFSRDRIRPAEYVDEGRYRYTLVARKTKRELLRSVPYGLNFSMKPFTEKTWTLMPKSKKSCAILSRERQRHTKTLPRWIRRQTLC